MAAKRLHACCQRLLLPQDVIPSVYCRASKRTRRSPPWWSSKPTSDIHGLHPLLIVLKYDEIPLFLVRPIAFGHFWTLLGMKKKSKISGFSTSQAQSWRIPKITSAWFLAKPFRSFRICFSASWKRRAGLFKIQHGWQIRATKIWLSWGHHQLSRY